MKSSDAGGYRAIDDNSLPIDPNIKKMIPWGLKLDMENSTVEINCELAEKLMKARVDIAMGEGTLKLHKRAVAEKEFIAKAKEEFNSQSNDQQDSEEL